MTYEYERVTTPAGSLRLHLNEHTRGCSPRVLERLRAMTPADAAFYPDYGEAVAAAARWFAVPPGQLILTNGLDEGIFVLSVVALRGSSAREPLEAIVVPPAFDMYAACADAVGGRVVEVPAGNDFTFPLDRVLAAIGGRTRLVFLTNPNNPTGRLLPSGAVRAIARAAPRATVLLDEAYGEFSGETFIAPGAFDELPNVVVGRTFAKAYGLAGLRIGALVGSSATLAPARRVVPPYSLNAAAALALPVALDDRGHFDGYLRDVNASKAMLYAAFDRLGIPYWPSAANFVLARTGPRTADAVQRLAAKGIVVRDRSGDHGCDGCIRITAGVVEHTQAAIRALEEVLCDGQ